MADTNLVYSLTNKVRDLSGAMHTAVVKYGGVLGLFKQAPAATNHKHEWLEDKLGGRGFTVTAYSASTGSTVSAEDYAKLKVGTRFRIKGYPVVFVVTALEDNYKVRTSVHAANGNTAKTAPAADDVCEITTTPVKTGSRNGDGENTHRSVGTNYNHTQIIRKDTGISRSDFQTKTADQVENSIARQTENAVDEARRDMARGVIWGVRTERNESNGVLGEAGGLYYFAAGGLEVDAGGARITELLINNAGALLTKNGGTPTHILLSTDQARVVGRENKDKVTVLQDDKTRGIYVAVIVNDGNGTGIKIIGDPDLDDIDCFVVDEACFGISEMQGLYDYDSTTKGTDGVSRTVLGEFTFEFVNANQRIARIKNLMAPASAMAEIANNEHNININGDVTATGAVTASGAISSTGDVAVTATNVTVTQNPA